ncbi:MAG: hypothetical protein RBS73_16990 [Prolixibacteraceae bacterium]|jgi:hypothetical protein|nr:hypothetical protein [Prolixibacteraceae bacterium]
MNDHCRQRKSGSTLAWILIVLGVVLILKNTGWGLSIPGIGWMFAAIGRFFSNAFHAISQIGWPLVLIIAGILLLIGRRFLGGLVLFLILLFILPKFILIPGILLILFVPFILIIAGIVILTKLF